VRLIELGAALTMIPKARRRHLQVTLERFADDHGWDEEIRGFCLLFAGFLSDHDAGTSLRRALDTLDGFDVTDGSLARLVREPRE